MDKLKVTERVTAAEAFKLSETRTLRDMYIAEELFNYCYTAFDDETDRRWKNLKILATIWNAGRIQGIREERAKKRKMA